MLLRSLLRSAATAGGVAAARGENPITAFIIPTETKSRTYAKAAGGKAKTTTKGKGKVKETRAGPAADDAAESASLDDINAEFELPTDPLPPTYDPLLDVGPEGRPLFSCVDSFSRVSYRDAPIYVDFRFLGFWDREISLWLVGWLVGLFACGDVMRLVFSVWRSGRRCFRKGFRQG